MKKDYQKSKDNQQAFFAHLVTPDCNIDYRFENDDTSILNEKAFSDKGRKEGFSGMNIIIHEKDNEDNCICLRCFLPEAANGHYQVNYNLPNNITSVKAALEDLSSQNMFFLTIRRKGLSVTFWLDRYDAYSVEDYSLVARRKGGRKDRIVLKVKDVNLKKFHYIDELITTLEKKLAI